MSKTATGAQEKDICELFGPYKLVARRIDGEHRAILWRDEPGKRAAKLLEVTAASNAEAVTLIERRYYESRLASSGGVDPSPDEPDMLKALNYVWPHLNEKQRSMLQAHYRAPGCRMTTQQLAEAAGYKGYNAVNLWYGKVGFMLFGEMPRNLLTDDKRGGAPVYTSMHADWLDKSLQPGSKSGQWQLRSDVASALERGGFVEGNAAA